MTEDEIHKENLFSLVFVRGEIHMLHWRVYVAHKKGTADELAQAELELKHMTELRDWLCSK